MKKIFIKASIILTFLVSNIFPAYASAPSPPAWLINANGGENPIITLPENGSSAPEKEDQKVPILLYHHISDEEFSNGNEISMISQADFRLHMKAIKVNFTPISLRHYLEYINCVDGSVTLPKNPIMVTFDDGYLSNYEIAYPILKALDIPATIFVVTDTVGETAEGGKVNYPHFNWEQAREMEKSGLIEIQSHTASHKELTTLEPKDMIMELRKSKYTIEKNLGKTCDMIAFPHGSYDSSILKAATSAGYKLNAIVDDYSTEFEFDVNLVSEGVSSLSRMTVAGTMGNVNVIEIVRNALSNKIMP